MLNIIWINTTDYTILQLILFGVGAALWIVNYVYIIRNIIKNKFVEMPAAVLAGNFAWEFLWSWVFKTDMGQLFQLGYQIWFFLDVVIVYSFYRFGASQLPAFAVKNFREFFTFGLISYLFIMYFYIAQGYDNAIGAHTAFLSNILISVLYLLQYKRIENKKYFSLTTAWTKWWGTGLITIMCFLKWPENYFILSMGVCCFVIDAYYTYIVYLDEKKIEN